MSDLKFHKVSTFPATILPDSVYFVDEGANLTGYVSNTAGDELKPLRYSGDLFQARKNTIQASTTGFTDVVAWDDVDFSDSIYSWNAATGELTINDTGAFCFNAHLLCDTTGNNRVELGLQIVEGATAIPGATDKNYATRNNNQDEGGVQISNFFWNVAVSGTVYKVQETRAGATANITLARFTVEKKR
jgi:hypothetical protein